MSDELPNDMKRSFKERRQGGVWVGPNKTMSTSPEAKQAAEEWWTLESDPKYWLMLEREKACEAYAIGYDAATAKLREEMEGMRRIIAADTEQIQQLAHQQPGPTPEVEEIADELAIRIRSLDEPACYISHEEMKRIVRAALAQARAPLVAALEELESFIQELQERD